MISLRNLMEEKQLDLNQPLLSVRRFTSTGTSSKTNEKARPEPEIPRPPVYKSELKSGPVRNPGTVPFVWEQTPGKPKDESTVKTQISKRPPLVPKLPPGRAQKMNQEVPTSINASLDENVRETVEEMTSCKSGNDDEEEDDEVYRDANDIFSRSESFFLNCSISGVSGLDDSEIKPSGVSSMDPHSRDFMMDRFLPAAKAMASETPPHTIRKQTVERPREIKLVMNGDRQSRTNLHVQTQHVKEIFREESDGEDDDFDESGYASTRGCGFLPRFCLKGSLVLVNPVPGMRMQATSVRRVRNSSTGSSKDAVNERRSSHGQGITRQKLEENASNIQEIDTFSLYRHLQGEGISKYPNEPSQAVHGNVNPSLGYTVKATDSVTNEYDEPCRRSLNSFHALLGDESGSASPVEKTLYIDSVHKITSPDSSSNSLDRKGISYNGDIIDDASIKSTEIKELCKLDSATQDVKNLNAVGEKNTLRPDSLKSMDSCLLTCSNRSLFEVKVDSNFSRLKPEHTQDAAKSTSSQFINNKKFNLENQFPLKPSSRGDVNGLAKDNTTLVSSYGIQSEKVNLDKKQPEKSIYGRNSVIVPEYAKKHESDGEKLSPVEDSPGLRTSERATNGEKDSRNQLLKRVGNEDGSRGGYSQSRLRFAPPPPKSPSESWLKRTLPTSSRNTVFLQSSFAMQVNPVSTTASPDRKTPSTVKSSDTYHLHLQFSKELLSSIPEV
ncbi:uncharacterized protein LOC111468130 [Cucurbita maxima]|uniref:Uncharacterized protein LOC111468130 n=1 Tax=Cucurbita maxima TaxID=3661 RepID=A0A6J1HZQ3_CUCMA|nr:uncharacterized protein LOC111468130 [Cucurbita maxima]XP_022968994.1 uncharacterized protein LOC111468130 [Cucurbita maxima]XP_022968996.1 uncharacterized protein LOC111468130 [Cucurbita maxima]XP_022968997.1 uncharacterized protein LOC111468130 [Cucurbita maxima]XP_022968998.1 uncharacterized protein LOC111468130 [Cucurbita maxima]